ncbi:hypothetical protein LJR234_006642 [Mesorhizobium amorphae]
MKFPELLTKLLEERIVQRHLWVALQKMRQGDYTYGAAAVNLNETL